MLNTATNALASPPGRSAPPYATRLGFPLASPDVYPYSLLIPFPHEE